MTKKGKKGNKAAKKGESAPKALKKGSGTLNTQKRLRLGTVRNSSTNKVKNGKLTKRKFAKVRKIIDKLAKKAKEI
jgi:hypothetical protein